MNTRTLAALLLCVSTVAAASPAEDDRATNARVRTALQSDLGGAARYIQVDSYGGTVQLSGAVNSRSTSERALLSAADVDGVNHVQDAMISAPLRSASIVD